MLSKWQWTLRQFGKKLWVRASLFAVLAIASALMSPILARLIPADLPASIGAQAVDSILQILASSMLAVTTFSLTVMVTHYNTVTSNVTPRATRLLLEDTTAQNALGTFIGSFLFSLVGIVTLSTNVYGERGRVVLFAMTIVVIGLIVLTLLRWIDHLSSLGRIEEPTERVETATATALAHFGDAPSLGGHPLPDPDNIPASAVSVITEKIGYVQHVDIPALSGIANDTETDIYLTAPAGTFVHSTQPVAQISGSPDDDTLQRVRAAFSIGDIRTFDSDPRFGLSVLAEIASRALSPGINDPGTAIDVIGRGVRVLCDWQARLDKADYSVCYERLWIPPLDPDDLLEHVFLPIGRDGAGVFEVQIQLQSALCALAERGGPQLAAAARRQSALALARSDEALALQIERERVRAAAPTG
ncbi:DUF2254 domain-containing protein [Amorphus sp. 3PC139-8]|uniref:DUF2254 domain-containing protein n=1 Tax=Amorphus sp. 3PC139-8 TaxID=2735676 RepID=UPI00345D4F11